MLAKDKGKLTDSKEDDPKEPATKSVKLNNDEPFEYLQQLINVFPNVSHQFLSQKAKEFEKKGDYFLQVIFFTLFIIAGETLTASLVPREEKKF